MLKSSCTIYLAILEKWKNGFTVNNIYWCFMWLVRMLERKCEIYYFLLHCLEKQMCHFTQFIHKFHYIFNFNSVLSSFLWVSWLRYSFIPPTVLSQLSLQCFPSFYNYSTKNWALFLYFFSPEFNTEEPRDFD